MRTRKAIVLGSLLAVALVAGCVGLSRKTSPSPKSVGIFSERGKSALTKAENESAGSSDAQKVAVESEKLQRGLSSRRTALVAGEFGKSKATSAIFAVPRKSISSTEYELLEGIHGSIKPVSHLRLVDSINGLHFYESTSPSSPLNAVFNHATGAVGIWTGELIVQGSRELLEKLAADFNLEVLHQEEGRAIFRAPPGFSLENDLPLFIATAAPGNVAIDIKYGGLRRQ